MISIIHPSRSRPEKALETFHKWSNHTPQERYILSLDYDDPDLQKYLDGMPNEFVLWFDVHKQPSQNAYIVVGKNRSAVDAINNAARFASGTLVVISDDMEPCYNWEYELGQVIKKHEDNHPYNDPWILKTYDGIQPYIITMPIMNKEYYKKFGYIYHPDFKHLFCDTYLTCVADIIGKKITAGLLFKHNHYSINGTPPDELHKRNDATWKEGQDTFIKLMKGFTPEERARIKDPSMRGFLRKFGL
jgi:hypothetical protein